MLKLYSKEFKENLHNYIIEDYQTIINDDDYPDTKDFKKICQIIYQRYKKEYVYKPNQDTLKRFEEWIMGVPSCFFNLDLWFYYATAKEVYIKLRECTKEEEPNEIKAFEMLLNIIANEVYKYGGK